jgi:hypothetical protein
MILIWCKRTADMTKHLCGSLCECLKMRLHIREQECEITAVMIMCHNPSRDPPEPFDTVGIGIIGRRIDQVQALLQFGEHATHEQGPSRRVRFEIIRNHKSDAPTAFGASHRCAHLFTEHISCPSRRNSAIEPAIAPIHQTKAIDLAVIARCLDQTLPTSTFMRPDTGERRVKGNLDLILQIQVGLRQNSQQSRQVGGKLIPQISLY